MDSNGDGSGASSWKAVGVIVTAIGAAALATITGTRSELTRQARRLDRLELHQEDVKNQLHRIADKLDKLGR